MLAAQQLVPTWVVLWAGTDQHVYQCKDYWSGMTSGREPSQHVLKKRSAAGASSSQSPTIELRGV